MTYRFGVFEFDADRLELSRDGRPVRLQPQPAQVLLTLVANAGRIVTREELRRAVWKDDTFVDFDRGLNFCIAQIRTALGDDAASPRYIRTAPKRGYEFLRLVDDGQRSAAANPLPSAGPEGKGLRSNRSRTVGPLYAIVAAVFVTVAVVIVVRAMTTTHLPAIVAVARFDNETGDPSLTQFADALTDTVTVQLAEAGAGRFGVIGNAAVLRRARSERDLRTIAASLNARFIVIGQVQRDSERTRVLAHLIRMPEQTHLAVSRTEDVGEPTLAATDEIAGTIARAFANALSGPAARDSRVAATR
ncbi:MAG TPA: winged helix-turn-helix domain-containing protein [Vicinamibacterales bacterium]|nr:winged helix-turn-helix domain-containing protein [Vicinamibacterales bacterium]